MFKPNIHKGFGVFLVLFLVKVIWFYVKNIHIKSRFCAQNEAEHITLFKRT